MVNDLDIEFPVSKEDYSKVQQKNDICINVFCYGNSLTYLVYASDQEFKDGMDLTNGIDDTR